MNNDKSMKTVLVSGGSRGIGAAVVRRLAADGLNVAFNYVSEAKVANALVDEVRANGGRALAIQGDVSKSDDFRQLFDQGESEFGTIDMLVNNAGLMSLMLVEEADEAQFDRMFAINVRGVLNGCKLAATRLRDGGAIVNLSTSVIGMAPPAYGPYCATKAAVEAITRSLSKELGKRRIRVNAVAPGPTDTELLSNANTPDRMQMYVQMTPLARLGHPDDIADVIAFLATHEARWINGQTLRVNGGIVA